MEVRAYTYENLNRAMVYDWAVILRGQPGAWNWELFAGSFGVYRGREEFFDDALCAAWRILDTVESKGGGCHNLTALMNLLDRTRRNTSPKCYK